MMSEELFNKGEYEQMVFKQDFLIKVLNIAQLLLRVSKTKVKNVFKIHIQRFKPKKKKVISLLDV